MIKIKNKFRLLFILSFSIGLILLSYYTYTFIQSREQINKRNEETIEFCEKNEYINTEYEDYCSIAISNSKTKLDFWTMLVNTFIYGFNKISFVLMLFVIVPSLIYPCQYFKNKIISNDLTREKYKNVEHKIFKNSYKSIIIIPLLVIIAFLICITATKTFDPTFAINNSTTGWSETTLNNPFIFGLLYILNTVIHSWLYINISLCIARKYHNYFVALILSFLAIIGLEAFLEIFCNGILFTTILKSNMGIIFNIMNFISFNDSYGMITAMIVPFVLAVISFIIALKLYKNKEKLIIDIEKNE